MAGCPYTAFTLAFLVLSSPAGAESCLLPPGPAQIPSPEPLRTFEPLEKVNYDCKAFLSDSRTVEGCAVRVAGMWVEYIATDGPQSQACIAAHEDAHVTESTLLGATNRNHRGWASIQGP